MSELVDSEKLQQEVPKITLGESECSYIDTQIVNYLQQFMEGLANEARTEFRDLGSLAEKIQKACWVWGQSPETYNASIDLKSLLVIRTLEDTVVRDDEVERDFVLPVLDPYWQQVDRQVYQHFSTYIVDETARGITPFEALNQNTPSPLCLMNDYLISRVDSGDSLVRYTATYFGEQESVASSAAEA